ncbi:MAG: nitroreductase family protein [Opitutales bacterium]|nr:nitroreductase family protein [Opitutales bacterium]
MNKPVALELLETICRAAMSAPSACNKQMWQFVITTKREELDAMIEFLPNAKMLASAQAAITICGDPAEDFGFYWQQDCSAATENALLAAHALGLGACWCGLYPREERAAATAKFLGIPENVIPMAILAIGYPDPTVGEKPKDKWKPEKIHYDHW